MAPEGYNGFDVNSGAALRLRGRYRYEMKELPTHAGVSRSRLLHSVASFMLILFMASPAIAADSMKIAEHLAGSIRFPTISPADPADFDGKPFLELAAYLRETYPLVHSNLELEVISE